jgi:hypothetical protein
MTDATELAKRAVSCKAWRWMPGMLVFSDPKSVPQVFGQPPPAADSILRARIQSVVLGRFFGSYDYTVDYPDAEGEPCNSSDFFNALPDLADPATIGCLLHLVREHWGDGGAHTRRLYRYGGGEQWVCCSPSVVYPTLKTHGATEAEALVKALELEVGND